MGSKPSDKKCRLKKKFNFADIAVLARNEKGEYQNLSLFDLESATQPTVKIDSDEPYLICFIWFIERESNRYYAKCTLEDLCQLAKLDMDGRFLKQLHTGINDSAFEQLVSLICTQKINSYEYGYAVCSDDEDKIVYSFFRNKTKDGKHCAEKVLEKEFILHEKPEQR